MTLTAQLGRAFDTLIKETSDLAAFRKVPTLMGEGLRRYYAETPSTQRELLLYRSYLESTGRHHALALLRSAAHDRDGARSAMKAWLRTLPRQADHQLQELADAGLLSQSDPAALTRASMQSEKEYAELLGQWMSKPS